MTMTTNQFCVFLVEQVPETKHILDEHVNDNDDLLPHVFFGDLTRYVMANGLGRRKIVELLEQNFRRHDTEVEELIAVSFVENLETEFDLEQATRDVDAKELIEEWRRQKT